MLYVDLPTRSEFTMLAGARADQCVTIYLTTTPVTQDVAAARIELGNLVREAQRQLEEAGFDKRRLAALLEHFTELLEDDEFWKYQANSLAVFATADGIRTYRLANDLSSMVQVSDRFHLQPLFRAITFSHSAFILALSENAVRLVEMHGDLPPVTIKVPDLPRDAASAIGKSTLNDRGAGRRIQGSEGQNVRFQQYARKVDAALRPILAGRETPLVLAATGRLAAVFPQVASYPHLAAEVIGDSPDHLSDSELAALARPILDRLHEKELGEIRSLFERRTSDRRTTTDIADAARAATYGAVEALLVDIDAVVPGFVDEETGAVEFVERDDAKAYGIVDEIVARAFSSGARIHAVRRTDMPGDVDLAAILRYPL